MQRSRARDGAIAVVNGFVIAALVVVAVCTGASVSSAQVVFTPPRVSGTPNPVGSGARALGWGGAFVAVADDATAASWNPAGLIQLELPELSMVGALPLRTESLAGFSRSNTFARGTEEKLFRSSDNEVNIPNLNYLSGALPFQLLGINFTAAINYQELFDFNREFQIDEITDNAAGGPTDFNQFVDFRQDGSLKTISPALAIQITPRLSLGFALNFWTDQGPDDDKITRDTIANLDVLLGGRNPQFQRVSVSEKFSNWRAFNANIGLLWNATSHLTIGAVVKTPISFKSDVDVEVQSRTETPFFANSPDPNLQRLGLVTNSLTQKFSDTELQFPLSYGLAFAWRFSDAFSMALDIFRTEWGDFERDGVVSVPQFDPTVGAFVPVPVITKFGADNLPLSASDVDPTMQIRLGGEYLIILDRTIIPIRAGVFYDPEPSNQHPRDFFGFAVGSGVSLGQFIVDAAYQFRYGRGFTGAEFGLPGEFEVDITQHTFFLSLIYHFE